MLNVEWMHYLAMNHLHYFYIKNQTNFMLIIFLCSFHTARTWEGSNVSSSSVGGFQGPQTWYGELGGS